MAAVYFDFRVMLSYVWDENIMVKGSVSWFNNSKYTLAFKQIVLGNEQRRAVV